jgi:hypothetical protein
MTGWPLCETHTTSDKTSMRMAAQHKTDAHPNQKECHTVMTRCKVDMTHTATPTMQFGSDAAHKLPEHHGTG